MAISDSYDEDEKRSLKSPASLIDVEHSKNYAPRVTKPPFLITFSLFILLCILLLENAVRKGIPVQVDASSQSSTGLERRQVDTLSSSINSATSHSAAITPSPTTSISSESVSTASFVTNPNAYIDTGATTSSQGSKSTTSAGGLTVSAAPKSSYIDVAPTLSAATNSYIDTKLTSQSTATTAPATVVASKTSGAYIDTKAATASTGTTSIANVSAAPPSSYIQTDQTTKVTSQGVTATSTTQSGSKAVTASTAVTAITSSNMLPSTFQSSDYSVVSITSKVGNSSVVLVSTSFSSPISSSYFVSKSTSTDAMGAVIIKTSTLSTAVLPVVTSSTKSDSGTVSELQLGEHYHEFDYFNATYLCVFVAITVKALWAMVFSASKLMEPFYQLNKTGGASAQESLVADYLSATTSLASLRSMIRGHWVMLTVSMVHGLISVIPPLATECMSIRALARCPATRGTGTVPCTPAWVLDVRMIRIVQAVLSLVLILVLAIIFLHWNRRSGIFANPASIASMASLLHHPDVLEEIRKLDHESDDATIAKSMSTDSYMLATHHEYQERERYGITKIFNSVPAYHTEYNPTIKAEDQALKTAMAMYTELGAADSTDVIASSYYHKRYMRKKLISDSIFLAVLIAMFGVVIAYYFDSSDSGFNTFFNSGHFGPRFILTACASILNAKWQDIEREVRVSTPYRRLAQRYALPQTTILANMNGTPISGLVTSISRREWFHFLICVVTCLSDVLIIAIGGVPYSPAQIWVAFLASAYVSMILLAFMIATVLALIFYWRKGNRNMLIPREPETLVSLWMSLCNEGNTLREEFADWEVMKQSTRDKVCAEKGGRYWGGWVQCEDGKIRWIIDREEDDTVIEYTR